MADSNEYQQLSFPVKISLWSQLVSGFSKNFRLFRYSSWIQVLHVFGFWVHVGVLGGTAMILERYQRLLQTGIGDFPGDIVYPLQIIQYYFYAMIGIFVVSYLSGVLMAKFGKLGIVPYLFFGTLLFQLAIAKVCFVPILFLTQ